MPEATALICGAASVSYRQLNARANVLAGKLKDQGVAPEIVVAVWATRSVETVVGILATLKAGGAYVPLDPSYPHERLSLMLADCGAHVLLGDPPATLASSHDSCRVIPVSDRDVDEAFDDNVTSTVVAENAAYILYTSGSTGKPKGVVVEHRNVTGMFEAVQPLIDAPDSTRTWLAVTTMSFDISILEVLWPLTAGYTVIVYPDNPLCLSERSSRSLRAQSEKYRVSHLQCTPSLAEVLADAPGGLEALETLSVLLIGGERFPLSLANKLSRKRPGRVLNMYGPTETTIWSTLGEVARDCRGSVPIGLPLSNTRLQVLNEELVPLGCGVPGELYIGGEGVARGYLNYPDLTARCFTCDPGGSGARVYRTGDRVVMLEDGGLDFLGRCDHQVKIRGHRVELEDIEQALRQHDKIKDAVVSLDGGNGGESRLVAFVVPAITGEVSKIQAKGIARSLKRHLAERVPAHMVPAEFAFLSQLPRTPNGKVDRRALRNQPC